MTLLKFAGVQALWSADKGVFLYDSTPVPWYWVLTEVLTKNSPQKVHKYYQKSFSLHLYLYKSMQYSKIYIVLSWCTEVIITYTNSTHQDKDRKLEISVQIKGFLH